jgi:hypothetical protein
MEELSQQLGDRLPAVLATTARGLGITTAEMVKLITSGELLADNSFFAAFASGIETTFIKGAGHVSGFRAELGRQQNQWNGFLTSLGDAGVIGALTDALKFMGPIVAGLGAAFITMGKTIGTVTAAAVDLGAKLLTLDFSGLVAGLRQGRDAARELTDEFQRKTGGLFNALDLFGIGSKKAADDAATLGTAAKGTAVAVTGAAGAATAAGKAHTDLGTAMAAAGVQAAGAVDNWVSLTVAFNKLIEKQSQAVEESTKLEKARKTEGAASVALAELAGNEVRTREAVSAAADGNLKAIQAVASARQSEADLTQIKIGALRQEAIDTNSLTDARKKELIELEQKLKLLKAEAVAANESAAAAQIESNARAVAVKLAQDNAGALTELAITTLEEQKGIATKADVQAATRRLAAAEALYHDALDDTAAALDRKAARVRLDLTLAESKLNVEKAQLAAQLTLAEMDGNDALALEIRIRQKQLEIRVIEAKIVAAKLEAAATIAGAEATKAALEAEGKLTEAKRAEIEASIANARVKLAEAQASGAALEVLQRQIENLQRYGNEAGAARGRSTAALNTETAALNVNTAAQLRNAEAAKLAADNAALSALATSFVNSPAYLLQQKLKGGTLGAGDVGSAQQVYDQALANQHAAQSAGFGDTAAVWSYQQAVTDARNALDAARSGAAAPTPTVKPGSVGSTTHTVNLTLAGGKSTSIGVASTSDAAALQSFLLQLSAARGQTYP